jgi:predicted DNA-binding protein (UPF0251 family)
MSTQRRWEKEAINLHCHEHLRPAEIARELGVDQEKVERVLRGAIKMLHPTPTVRGCNKSIAPDKNKVGADCSLLTKYHQSNEISSLPVVVEGSRCAHSLSDETLVHLYTVVHLTMGEIGILCGVTRQAIWRRLQKLRVDSRSGEHVTVECVWCGKDFERARSTWRKVEKGKSRLGHFCGEECRLGYLRAMGNGESGKSRHGQRRGRSVVAAEYGAELPEGSVVHHVDGNQYNNERENLMLFASQSDHIKWHRRDRSKVRPLWSGRV